MATFILNGGTNAIGGRHTQDIFDAFHDLGVQNVLVVPYALDGRSKWLSYCWRKPRMFIKDKRFNVKTTNWGDSSARLRDQLNWADALLIVGGNPRILIERLREKLPSVPATIQAVAGVSAGAMTLGTWYSQTRNDEYSTVEGMSWVKGTIIDVHVAQRGRQARVIEASLQHPEARCYGLDEYMTIQTDEQGTLVKSISGTPLLIQEGKPRRAL